MAGNLRFSAAETPSGPVEPPAGPPRRVSQRATRPPARQGRSSERLTRLAARRKGCSDGRTAFRRAGTRVRTGNSRAGPPGTRFTRGNTQSWHPDGELPGQTPLPAVPEGHVPDRTPVPGTKKASGPAKRPSWPAGRRVAGVNTQSWHPSGRVRRLRSADLDMVGLEQLGDEDAELRGEGLAAARPLRLPAARRAVPSSRGRAAVRAEAEGAPVWSLRVAPKPARPAGPARTVAISAVGIASSLRSSQ
jgi:hypothetical protein